MQYNPGLNTANHDNWAPVHIAARKGNKDCIIWIINYNKQLRHFKREIFDLNLKGKNDWTPLHLAANSYKLEETYLLLEEGCDVFAKNVDNKIPRKVTNGNYLLNKLLKNYENDHLYKKYLANTDIVHFNTQNCFTTVEEISNIDDQQSSFIRGKLLPP